jgi:hypothetical protein
MYLEICMRHPFDMKVESGGGSVNVEEGGIDVRVSDRASR